VYVAGRLASAPWGWAALAVPFALIWIVPVFYWTRDRGGEESWLDQAAHQASYLSMAWVSFILVLTRCATSYSSPRPRLRSSEPTR